MPAMDECQPQVIRALEKAGCKILSRTFFIKLMGQRGVYADLRIRRSQQEILVVEIKCFTEENSQLRDFYQAVGQYLFYRNALALAGILSPVYLAVPQLVFANLFQKPTLQATLKDARIKLIVVDLQIEEVTAWID